MTDDSEIVKTLGAMTTRDDAGRHFYEVFPADVLNELEAAGLINIRRPVHGPTGLPYSGEHHAVALTDAGLQFLGSRL